MNVTLYTKESPPCNYCEAAKQLLDKKGIEYENLVIGRDIDRDRVIEENPGWRTVPMVFIDGQMIGGFRELESYVLSKDLT
tara:strand:+ start:5669 stop:5911 length:243 start_codon:yes stop_codon:yes gene_type:complete